MNVIIEKAIYGKVAQLVLMDDGITVNVVYDGKIISSSAGNTWNNICDAGMKEEYLDITAEGYAEDAIENDEFEKRCKELGWGVKACTILLCMRIHGWLYSVY